MKTNLTGKWGEVKAAEYLRKKKYSIVGMGYRSRFGEIDIIAEDKRYVVFVEVKTRKSDRFAKAMEYVTEAKAQRVRTTAQLWLAQNDRGLQPRFDVIEVYAPQGAGTEAPEINHIEDAF